MRTDDIDEFILCAEDQVDLRPAESEYESEFTKAKTFLQKQSAYSGDNLYNHLAEVLNKILAERPENIVDFFEEDHSRKIKEKRFRNLTDHLEDIYVAPARFQLAKKYEPLLKTPIADEPSTTDPNYLDIADMSKSDMLQLLYYFEHVGIGLPRSEMFAIVISMRNLVKQAPINSVRFWGKIYGIYHNYLILEAEFTDEEILRRTENEEKLAQAQTQASEEAKDGEKMEKSQSFEGSQISPLGFYTFRTEGGKAGKVAGVEPETGPPLLTPLSEDASLEAMPPWSARLSSEVLPEFAVAVVRSNLWPGAYCFSTRGKLFQNVYLGNGLKYIAHNFSPRPLPDVQQDYIIGPEIMEMPDPKGALEEEWRIAHLPKPPMTTEDQEEEQEEEGDKEEPEEDED